MILRYEKIKLIIWVLFCCDIDLLNVVKFVGGSCWIFNCRGIGYFNGVFDLV